jgi:hypothetical protein
MNSFSTAGSASFIAGMLHVQKVSGNIIRKQVQENFGY